MDTITTATVDQYLSRHTPAVRAILERVRRTIRRALPGADEVISYSIPAYRLHGQVVIFFAGWKEHFSIYPATGQVTEVFKRELAPYRISKGTIRFPLSARPPLRLIAGIARIRAREAAERAAARQADRGAAREASRKPAPRRSGVARKKAPARRTAALKKKPRG